MNHPELSLPEGMRYLSTTQQFAVLLDKLDDLQAYVVDNQQAIAGLRQDVDKILAYVEARQRMEQEANELLRKKMFGKA